MVKIRTAIFGAGFGRYGHFAALKRLSQFEVVSVCGSQFQTDDKIKSYSSADWLQAFHENPVDLAVIAVPPEKQTPLLLEAMKRGLAVMVEKPLCLTESEYLQISNQYNASKNISAASFIFPELETWKKAKTMLQEEILGKIRTVYFDWKIESQAIKNKMKNWKSSGANGGSALFHFLPHLLQGVQFFFGDVKKLSCVSLPAADLGPEMGFPICSVQMKLTDDLLISINCTLAAPFGSGQSIEMNGSKGSLILENKGSDYVRRFKLKVQTAELEKEFFEIELNPYLTADLDSRTAPLTAIYLRLAKALAGGDQVSPGLIEALHTQRLILQCQQSHELEKWITVKV